MSSSPIKRIAALPLTLAVAGIALIALAALPPADSELPSAQAATADSPVTAQANQLDED